MSYKVKQLFSIKYSFFLGILSGFVFAPTVYADSFSDFGSLFVAPDSDISKNLLSYMFGRMEGVLTSGGSPLLGMMFSVFNSTVLAVGGIVILYTLFVSTLNTAHQGEVMGKNWSSVWIPFRSGLGVALLLPKASGYSVIQIGIMWITLQGIGAADTLWNVVVDYLNKNGSTTSANIISPSVNSLITAQSNIVKIVGCMQAINAAAGQNPPPVQQNPSPIIASPLTAKVTFGGDPSITGSLDPALCGIITWAPVAGYEADYAIAIQGLIDDATLKTSELIQDAQQSTSSVGAATTLENPAKTYFQQVSNLGITPSSKIISEDQKAQGWILAGSYYNLLAQSDAMQGTVSPPSTIVNTVSLSSQFYATTANTYINYINTFVNLNLPSVLLGTASDESLGMDVDTSNIVPQNPGMLVDTSSIGQGTSADFLSGSLQSFQEPFHTLSSNTNSSAWVSNWLLNPNTDPIAQVQQMGASMLNTVETIWIVGGLTMFIVTTILSIAPSINPLAASLNNLILWIVPLLMSMLLFVFIGGAMLAYYVPMLPFLFFTFGALGWFMAIIEAIIAGPLVALGILHPEGHEVYGEAKPAVMLLLNVLLRPSLMIFALVTTIALSYATIAIVNMGFANAVNGIYTNGGMLSLTSGIALIILYVAIIVAALTFVTHLIIHIPNRVFRWIGGSIEGYGEEQAVGEAQKGFNEGMSGVGKGMGNAASKSGKLAKKMTGGGEAGGGGGASQGGGEKAAAEVPPVIP